MQYPANADQQKDDVLIADPKRPERDLSRDLCCVCSDYTLDKIVHELG
jgi:hypothetical protein